VRAHNHISTLSNATELCLDKSEKNGNSNDMQGCFCNDCVQRIALALDENTERLNLERQAYVDVVKDEKNKQKRLEKALSINLGALTKRTNEENNSNTAIEINDNVVENTIRTFEQEMVGLAASCGKHENELERLNQHIMDQIRLSEALTAEEDAIITEFNALEIDARSFEVIHQQLTLQCYAADREVAALSCVRLHSALFDIIVDERGQLYPLINDLRFSHRPKGDLRWSEINAAWSQAAQLLMFIGSSIRFTSPDLRIVCLTNCAKIINVGADGNKRIVHNLGVELKSSSSIPTRRKGVDNIVASLRAFHALLQQMVDYLRSLGIRFPSVVIEKPPFDIGPTYIGSYTLTQLEETDDATWNAVIHCMVSNMKWLSHNASSFSSCLEEMN